MNKKTSILIQIVLWSLLFVFICGVSGKLYANNSFAFGQIKQYFKNDIGDNQMVTSSKSFENVNEVTIDTYSYNVTVEEYDGDKIIIEANISDNSSDNYAVYQENDHLYFHQKKKPFNIINFSRGEIVIKVPEGLSIEWDIDTISGDVSFDAPCTELGINATSGKVNVYKSGNELDVKTVSGAISVYAAFNDISAKVVSGSIKLVADENTSEIEAKTTSGSIKVELNETKDYVLEYKTVSGNAIDEYSGMSGGKSGKFYQGDKHTKISASSVSGNIYLSDWQ